MSIRNVYSHISSFEALLQAEHDVGKGKSSKKELLRFRENLEENILDDVKAMRNLNFPSIQYKSFMIYEPKARKVIYTDYNSKVIERCIYNTLNPLICKSFITDTYSCVEGRGQLRAMLRLYNWFNYVSRKPEKWYYYKLDVAKYFYRIDHDILINKICRKKIGDKNLIEAIRYYICNGQKPFGLRITDDPRTIKVENMLYGIGIPVGGGLSHTLGNMVLDPIDQLAKRKLGIKYYIRYMDDIIFLGNDKELMKRQKKEIEAYLNDELHLQFNNKCALRPITVGCEFVGCQIYTDHVILRKQTTLRMKRHLRKLQEEYRDGEADLEKITQTVASYKALLKHVNCRNFNLKLWEDFVLSRQKSEVGKDV